MISGATSGTDHPEKIALVVTEGRSPSDKTRDFVGTPVHHPMKSRLS
jgi:hypothetical protein